MSVGGERRGRADAVRREGDELDLARRVGERDEAPVGEEARGAVAGAVVVRDLGEVAFLARGDEDAAARGQGDRFSVGRDVRGGEPVERPVDRFGA